MLGSGLATGDPAPMVFPAGDVIGVIPTRGGATPARIDVRPLSGEDGFADMGVAEGVS